jgi:hypothetical protein
MNGRREEVPGPQANRNICPSLHHRFTPTPENFIGRDLGARAIAEEL